MKHTNGRAVIDKLVFCFGKILHRRSGLYQKNDEYTMDR